MDIQEYKNKVIEHFKSGKATNEQWAEMADAILHVSETNSCKKVFMIDMAIDPENACDGDL